MKTYWFGKNWKKYIENNFSEAHLLEAEKSLINLIGDDKISGYSFLDIGCGSGIFSLAALRLGASRVTSIDIDQDSIECCRQLQDKFKMNVKNYWEIKKASILDNEFLNSVSKYNIVYSWGVLHHTGNMWQAIENACGIVEKNGYLIIGIYNWQGGRRGTRTWQILKKWYCKAPRWQSIIWEYLYISFELMYMVLVFRNPIKHISNYNKNRGMSWFRDVSDWLGGYPYEAATPGEVLSFVKNKFNFELVRQNINCGLGISEFVFKSKN